MTANMVLHEYKFVEIMSKKVSTDIGDWTETKVADRGSTLAAIRKDNRVVTAAVTKHCLANYVPGLAEATIIVHIPRMTSENQGLDSGEWMQAFWYACNGGIDGLQRVPVWTQSSIKGTTFYMIEQPMFNKVASVWNKLEDGPKFSSYFGLVFSEMDQKTDPIFFNIREVLEPEHGEDGNCTINSAIWSIAKQFRAMQLNEDGIPVALGKGIVTPIHDDIDLGGVCPKCGGHIEYGTCMDCKWDIRENAMAPKFNTTQIKWGGAGRFIVLGNNGVSSKVTRAFVSCEPILMLKDIKPVREYLVERVKRAVAEAASLLTEERRADLLQYLGGLHYNEDGELESAKRAVIEALRSNMPWCQEIEERISRFMIRAICESIIPSGGIDGRASLQVVNDEHGEGPCAWKDAKYIAFRIPVTGAIAVIPLKRNPYKPGIGMVVTPEVAKMDSGDADGDRLIVVSDKEAVALYRQHLNHELVSGLKPEKGKAKAELSAEWLMNRAINQVGNNWMVGALNIAAWKLIQLGRFAEASNLLDLANTEPMTYKHNIVIDGQPFAKFAIAAYNAIRDDVKDVHLQWREKAHESRGWKSLREMCDAKIEEPASLIDACWNAGVEAVQEWADGHPLKPLSMPEIARITFGENGIVIPGSAWREARDVIVWWGKYWTAHKNETDNKYAYNYVGNWGKTASREAIAALLVWRPKNPEKSGFSLKWAAAFMPGRVHEVMGLHPCVHDALFRMMDEPTRMQYLLKLVNGYA